VPVISSGMIHAINCGADGAPNSFTNFKNSALAIGAQLKASAGSPPTSTMPYSYPSSSPSPSPATSSGSTIEVIVGGPNGNLSFTPSRVSAAPGQTVKFTFQVKNHTVTQSSFNAPCMPLTDTTGTKVGFDSGFFPVAAGTTDFPTWSLTVNDTSPIWAYCRQAGHCGSGMVFAINSDETSARNWTAFQNLAKSLNGTSSNSTTPNAGSNTGYSSGATSNSVGSGLVVAVVAALVGSLL
jgi:plastocyanin